MFNENWVLTAARRGEKKKMSTGSNNLQWCCVAVKTVVDNTALERMAFIMYSSVYHTEPVGP